MTELLDRSSLPSVSLLEQKDWTLHRKGPIDQARHNQKVKEVIKNNLGGIVGQENIITSDGKTIVKIPIRSLDLPVFRHGQGKQGQVGQGEGGTKPGDVIGQAPGQQPGGGPGAGEIPGIDYYEAEMTIDELTTLVFEDLSLPFLEDKGKQLIQSESYRFKDIRRSGAMANLDKKRTILENLKRNAMKGDPRFHSIRDEDLRFKTWDIEMKEESSAVVVAMRDVSGSMGEFEKYITRSFYFWMVRFLRTKYRNVEIVFITHHSEAKEVDEDAFFKLGESGGTKVSSAYQLCSDIVESKYPAKEWNIYPFHFSDGDNWGEVDNIRCTELVKKLLAYGCNTFGYGEIQQKGRVSPSTLMTAFKQVMEKEPRFIGVTIASKEEVFPALKRFFSTRTSEAKGIKLT